MNTPKLLAQETLSGGTDTIYTVPADTRTLINNVSLTNVSGSGCTVTITTGTSGSEKTWRKDLALDPDETVEFNGVFILEATHVLKMVGSAADSIHVLLSGLEVT